MNDPFRVVVPPCPEPRASPWAVGTSLSGSKTGLSERAFSGSNTLFESIPTWLQTQASIPDVPFVPFDLIASQPLAQFILERLLCVVFLLFENVLAHGLDIGLTYRERGIAGLPMKLHG